MRRFSFLLAALWGLALHAQDVKRDEMAFVYFMPKNTITIEIEYQQTVQKKGLLAAYAKSHLGYDAAIKSDKTHYTLTHFNYSLNAQADTSRPVKINLGDGNAYPLVVQDGLLIGFNVPSTQALPMLPKPTQLPKKAREENDVLPLLEEQMANTSLLGLADGAAKQIFRLREIRTNLLAGDVERMPADGKALRSVLQEIDKQEKRLVNAFIGTSITTQQHKTFTFTPNGQQMHAVIAYFSANEGVTSSKNPTAMPIHVYVSGQPRQMVSSAIESNKKSSQHSPIYYNIPGIATLQIVYNERVELEAQIELAQWGISQPLPRTWLNGQKAPHVYFNHLTGNIQSISQ